MSKHVSYRGTTIDMDSIRRENESTVAVGNQSVNAKGDLIKNGMVTKTADQIARENHRVQSLILKTGLKGEMPKNPMLENDKVKPKESAKVKEKELPNGDIVLEKDNGTK